MRKKSIGFVLSFVSLAACMTVFSDQARFMGELEFLDDNCKADRRCVLKRNFGYRDPFGVSWQAPAGDETDGASIPEFLWDQVGKPFDDDLVQAAVIHDFYCKNRVRSWQQTHRVFYDALISSGVPKSRADLLYAGVLVGGPRWNLDGEMIDFGFDPDQVEPEVVVVETPVVAPEEGIGEEAEGEPVIVASDEELVEEDGFSDREQETLNDDQNTMSEYDYLAILIAENPDLEPEAIANLASQVAP